MPCDREITRKILEGMIEAKVQHYFKLERALEARLCTCFANWWLRVESALEKTHSESLDSFKRSLGMDNEKEEWADKDGVPILLYAVIQNDIEIVRTLIQSSS